MNDLKLVAAVAITAVVTDRVVRFRINRKNRNLAPHYRALIESNKLLITQCEGLVELLEQRNKVNGFLLHQNEYLVGMLNTHNVPVTEFDRIAMTYPIETEE